MAEGMHHDGAGQLPPEAVAAMQQMQAQIADQQQQLELMQARVKPIAPNKFRGTAMDVRNFDVWVSQVLNYLVAQNLTNPAIQVRHVACLLDGDAAAWLHLQSADGHLPFASLEEMVQNLRIAFPDCASTS